MYTRHLSCVNRRKKDEPWLYTERDHHRDGPLAVFSEKSNGLLDEGLRMFSLGDVNVLISVSLVPVPFVW